MENVDPELQPVDGAGSNKRRHDDVADPPDVEDIAGHQNKRLAPSQTPTVTKHSSTWLGSRQGSWREVLGPPPSMGTTHVRTKLSIILWYTHIYVHVYTYQAKHYCGTHTYMYE